MCFDFLSLDPSLALFIGQKMEVWLALPTSEKTSYSGKIIGLEKINNKTLRVRVEPVSISANITNDLAEILAFQFKVTPETLRSLDFPIRIFRNRLQFRFVENMQDYCAVLELRKNAYVEVGKRALSTTAEQMSIEWDNTSRILCAFHEQKLVASAALTFPSHQSFVLRTEAVFPGGKFPEPHPNKLELLEINCLCTQKDYRKGDLLHALFEHIARIFVLSNRKYIMNLSDSHLLPMYLGIGFENMHQKGIFLGKEHHLIRGSRDGVVIGKGLRLLHWCMLYGDLVEELLSKDLIALSKWERIIVKSKLAFKPIAKRLARLKREKDFQKNVLARTRIDI
jgi:hypothetical protein